MEPSKKEIPVSIEDFKELIDGNNYYIDKTDLIEATFHENAVLYTRPRRFGKTLNMSMLYYFYSMHETKNRYLFDGLRISSSAEALKHQNQYPVIFLSLKDISDSDFPSAMESFADIIRETFSRFPELQSSSKLSKHEKDKLDLFLSSSASFVDLKNSLRFLTECLYKHHGAKSVILIDEYDVPLNKAWTYSYYDEMCEFIRSMFSRALKSNMYLKKTILTGCLRISKESIFTGLNNLKVCSISDTSSSEYFGFTQQEIDDLYTSFGFADKLWLVKKWYDGYRFGRTEIYNPWSALMYLDNLINDSEAEPEAYWANSSENAIILECLKNSSPQTRQEFDDLIHGKSIVKPIREELTYREISNPANIYSFLLLTGYLKSIGKTDRRQNELMIPNLEVRTIYEDQFQSYFEYIIGQMK